MPSCGLITESRKQVPLKSVEVEVQVKGHVATVTSTLQYVNEEESPLEAVFVFPLPAEAALCHFSAKIADQEVVAEVQEKKKAREEYDDAICSGQQAFLLEESDQSPDVFRLAVGNLPPKESAAVTLIYVTELAVQADDGLRFCLPAVLNPRYAPSTMDPINVLEVVSVPASMVPYTLSFSVHIISPSPISKVESNCSLEPLTYLDTAQTQAKVSLSSGHKFDRDVEILLYYQDPHQPTAIVEAGHTEAKPGSLMGDPVVMVSLYPEFPTEVASSFGKRGEFIFLMDQSGSMVGSSIRSAQSVEYSQRNMDEAMVRVKAMKANMWGTEILKPLEHIYRQHCLPDHPRQVFVFTDGHVSNTKAVLDLVRTHSRSHRCFTFGIGQGASTALITGMAKEGGGTAQFITRNDRLQLKVMQSLSNALQPCVVDISVKWTLPEGVSVTTLSPPPKILFQAQRALLYAQLTGESSGLDDGSVTVQYSLAEQSVTNQLNFCLKPAEDTGLGVHRLAARCLIQSLEKEEREKKDESLREKIVELSMQAGVSSAFTAFLAVHKSSGQPVKGPLMRKTLPVAHRYYANRLLPFQQLMSNRSCNKMDDKDEEINDDADGLEALQLLMNEMSKLDDKDEKINDEDLNCDEDRLAEIPGDFLRDFNCDEAPLGEIGYNFFNPVARECFQDVPDRCGISPVQKKTYLELVTLQKAAGYWDLETELLKVFGKTEKELAEHMPKQVDSAVWATVLALIWLHSFMMAEQEEWKFIAKKATSWIRSQKVSNLSECVQAGNALLGCQVREEDLGL